MLKLDSISKTYVVGDLKVEALKDFSIEFRKNEFVSILGPSGCGKTTLLNIIGGLDRYTTGDLIINEKSTKQFKDKDWDTYRNHSVGFVFQSYNLIEHQTVLENVELALTLSGVSKQERRKRAIEVLKKVGLEDKIKTKPKHLSGGQMQRVAIARALVNDPEIILADEPTGALDSTTSVQIMELLKEISKDKLIVMVTHNPELAEKYSTRIVKLFDGKLVGDTKPYKSRKKKAVQSAKKSNKTKMSYLTALGLSFKNLLTKKGRTILVAIAGSIGIIGIALILAISSGFSTYVNQIQQNTLSSNPVSISNSNYDMASLMEIFLNKENQKHEDGKVHVKNELTDMLTNFNGSSRQNDLKLFKEYLESEDVKSKISNYTTAIQYDYGLSVNAYYNSDVNGLVSANATSVFNDIIQKYPLTHPDVFTGDKALRYGLLTQMFATLYSSDFWSEMLDNRELLKSQYELVGDGSKWATEYNEVMIVVDENNEISDYTLYGLGLLDHSRLETLLDCYINNVNAEPITTTYTYEDLLNLEYRIILESDYYEKQADDTYLDIRNLAKTDPSSYATKLQNLYNTKSTVIKVAGLIREKEDASTRSIKTCIAYSSDLSKYLINLNNNSSLVQAQLQENDKNILTNTSFNQDTKEKDKKTVLKNLGYIDMAVPQTIYLYPLDFESKNEISAIIEDYNNNCKANNQDEKVITYTDTASVMMQSMSTIISAITYVLIAFVGVSLVVSSIMIGIITYISVIERTKEIGILRSVGASKKDIRNVFMAESFIIGLSSGAIGIGVSLLSIIPINIILKHFTSIANLAGLPVVGALVLIGISILLTLIAGFIPSKLAAKKDPVVALRSN